jgi:release factor glutamine methyltransferase
VGPGVLIPRPETETLIEEALKHFPDRDAQLNVLDLGTGSGALLLSMLSERPNATGTGVEISPEALAFAERNAIAHGLTNRARFIRADWSMLEGSFNIVLANPPYIASRDIESLALDVAGYEPHIALDGGADGVTAYRRIAEISPRLLARQGAAFIEMGQGQAARGLAEQRIVKDLAGISRCLVLVHAMEEPQVKQKIDMEKETRSG